jgi:hypothetical protein
VGGEQFLDDGVPVYRAVQDRLEVGRVAAGGVTLRGAVQPAVITAISAAAQSGARAAFPPGRV